MMTNSSKKHYERGRVYEYLDPHAVADDLEELYENHKDRLSEQEAARLNAADHLLRRMEK